MNEAPPLIEVQRLCKTVRDATGELPILRDVSFALAQRQTAAIVGASGSGKSTLLSLIAGLDVPSSGTVRIAGQDLFAVDEDARAAIRARRLSFVFQNFQLVGDITALKNVMLPLMIKGLSANVCKNQATKLLKHVNLLHRAHKYPNELSGGEQQRAAMARALAHNPNLLLCDEPTGSLDEYSSDVIWGLLRSAKEFLGICIVVVTHKVPSSLRVPYRHFVIEDGHLREIL